MNSLFSFFCNTGETNHTPSTLVIFSGLTRVSHNDLRSQISNAINSVLSPEIVYLIYPDNIISKVEINLASDDAFLPLAVDTDIYLWSYNQHGSINFCKSKKDNLRVTSLPETHVRRQGLTELFIRRGGVLEAGPSAHFVKPSGRIDSRFLRAAHALSEGSEIFFAALWILPFLNDEIKYIHIDTSSIASVVYAALLMSNLQQLPTVTTFHSYAGLDKNRFSLDRQDIVLISATQSGSMAQDIRNYMRDGKNVITLFSTADGDTDESVLCNLNWDKAKNALGLKPVDRDMKASDSRPIRIIGEQFYSAIEAPRALVPSIKHAPSIVKNILSKVKGKNVFSCNKHASGKLLGIWVNTSALTATKEFADWVDSLIVRHIPVTTRAMVTVRGEKSNRLQRSIIRKLKNNGGTLRNCILTTLEKIENVAEPLTKNKVPIVITSTTAGNGDSLLEVSRELRKWSPNSYRIFISLVTIAPSSKSLSMLKSNLSHGGHTYISLFDIIIDRYRLSESWRLERELYQAYDEDALPALIRVRLERLNSNDGLVDDLFLDGKNGKLSLRDNFAFWPGTSSSAGSQADIFVTISVVLENMRSGSDVEIGERLINDANIHSILSSEAFYRYNDGAIQAAFLRASYPIELNYKDTPDESSRISSMLCGMCNMVDKSQGEALTEFFLALVLDRLKLCESDVISLCSAISKNRDNFSEVQSWLASLVERKLEKTLINP